MRYLIVLGFILVGTFPNVLSFCDFKDEKFVKQCHEVFNNNPDSKLVNVKKEASSDLIPIKDEKYCKILLERSKCLEKVDSSCLDPEHLAREAGDKKPEVLDQIFFDYAYQFSCLHGYKPTKADQKCSDESVLRQACDPVPLFLVKSSRNCESKKKQLDCRRKVLEEKCKNKDFVQFQDDKERWASEAVLPNCHFNFNIKIKTEAPQKKGIFAKIRGLFG
uniref:DUF19 domain-containing protein n=1 Tax=Panagrolaimus sp. PS1159 TaxID=55785 RepID=A0AC35FA34_9BILA